MKTTGRASTSPAASFYDPGNWAGIEQTVRNRVCLWSAGGADWCVISMTPKKGNKNLCLGSKVQFIHSVHESGPCKILGI